MRQAVDFCFAGDEREDLELGRVAENAAEDFDAGAAEEVRVGRARLSPSGLRKLSTKQSKRLPPKMA
jgi:hypothetical protein